MCQPEKSSLLCGCGAAASWEPVSCESNRGPVPPKLSRESSVSSRVTCLPAVALATAATASGAGRWQIGYSVHRYHVGHSSLPAAASRHQLAIGPLFISSFSATCLRMQMSTTTQTDII